MNDADRIRTVKTNCRICDPHCGIVASVRDGRITDVAPNREHVFSRGHMCIKAKGAVDILYDADRVVRPLKRTGAPGEFTAVSWDEALADIAARLKSIRKQHGGASIATFSGNPAAYSYAATLWTAGFQAAVGVKWRYGVNSEDGASRVAANQILYGSPALLPKPDFWRTDFALVLGANPFISHGSGFTEPRVREAMESIVNRGGRVVVVDPRRTETARHFEHIPIPPGSDPYFLLALLRVLFDDNLVAANRIGAYTRNLDTLRSAIAPFTVEDCAARCRLPPASLRALARDLAAAARAFVYGRCGTCQQMFGTLNNMLQDTLTILTGNLDRPGGLVFGWGAIDFEKFFAAAGGPPPLGAVPTRVYGHPDVAGLHPSTSLAPDISVPGDEQVRALVLIAANPVLSSANGGATLETALERLDLHISLDLYVNETNKHAHYVLPTTTFYEREDFPLMNAAMMLRPSVWWSDAVVAPHDECREEWRILQDIARGMGLGGAYALPTLRLLSRCGIETKPRHIIDVLLRTGPCGDLFGLRPRGLSVAKLKRFKDGLALRPDVPVHNLTQHLSTSDKRINLCCPTLLGELERLRAEQGSAGDFPLRLIGMRELRSHNTWMHNSKRLAPHARRHAARVNPADAAAAGIRDGDEIIIESKSGRITVPAQITEEVTLGAVAVPHGWGHAGGWRHANAGPGVNSNILASGAREDIEAISGMSVLNGVPVRISRANAKGS